MPSPWVTELRANLRQYKSNLEKRGLLGDKLGITSDRKQRLAFLEKAMGLEDPMEEPKHPAQNVQHSNAAGIDDAFHEPSDEEVEEQESAKRAYGKQRIKFQEEQAKRNKAIRDAFKEMGTPIPDNIKITDENREEYYHKICEYALSGEKFGNPLTRKGRDNKPSELFQHLDAANKSYTTQLHATLNAKKLSEKEKCERIGVLTAGLKSAEEKVSTLTSEKEALQSEKDTLQTQLDAAKRSLDKAKKDVDDEKEAVKNQKRFITEDQKKIAEHEKKIADLDKQNKALETENKRQAQEISTLKEANQGLRARFFSFITSFLGYLHNERNIKITGEGAFDAQKASDMVEDYRAKTLASRKQAAVKTSGKSLESTSSSFFDSAWATLFGSSEPASTSSSTKHASTKGHGTAATPPASHISHGKR